MACQGIRRNAPTLSEIKNATTLDQKLGLQHRLKRIAYDRAYKANAKSGSNVIHLNVPSSRAPQEPLFRVLKEYSGVKTLPGVFVEQFLNKSEKTKWNAIKINA